MDSIINLGLYGIFIIVFEPFSYGCVAFVLSYRFNKSLYVKIITLIITLVLFISIEHVWLNHTMKSVNAGIAIGDQDVAKILENESDAIGKAEFNTGDKSDLMPLFDFTFDDLLIDIMFIFIGYFVGMVITRRRWKENIKNED